MAAFPVNPPTVTKIVDDPLTLTPDKQHCLLKPVEPYVAEDVFKKGFLLAADRYHRLLEIIGEWTETASPPAARHNRLEQDRSSQRYGLQFLKSFPFVGHGAYDLARVTGLGRRFEEWLRRNPINKDAKVLIKSGGAAA
ncbi:MAG: hypothetical protein QXU87_11540 [Candidatus Caldarchaeum sp.]